MVDVGRGTARVELGEGVFAECRLPSETAQEVATAGPDRPDVSALSAMLSAKWKQGKGAGKAGSTEAARAGQIRSFRITGLDPERKRVDVELAG
jgi:small subunit ribosomal protein S1